MSGYPSGQGQTLAGGRERREAKDGTTTTALEKSKYTVLL